MPSSSGKDNEGLSVSVAYVVFRALHRRKFVQDGRNVCSTTAEAVRSIKTNEGKFPLDVEPDPILDDQSPHHDPAHALITGMPPLPTDDPDVRALIDYLAQELARSATEYLFPPDA